MLVSGEETLVCARLFHKHTHTGETKPRSEGISNRRVPTHIPDVKSQAPLYGCCMFNRI